MEFKLFTDEKEEARRLKICKTRGNNNSHCEFYKKDLTFLWFFKLKGTAQCNDCKCPIINKITLLNPHCKYHGITKNN